MHGGGTSKSDAVKFTAIENIQHRDEGKEQRKNTNNRTGDQEHAAKRREIIQIIKQSRVHNTQ